jgi:hypothetical protein
VPITGRTAAICASTFRDYVAWLIGQTICDDPVLLVGLGARYMVSFRSGGQPIAVPIETREHGRLFFSASQVLEAFQPEGKRAEYQLRTLAYEYRLQATDDANAGALIRWEYQKVPEAGNEHPRHHMHTHSSMEIAGKVVDLTHWHVATNYTLLEDVLRFLIADLGVRPRRVDWSQVLSEGEERFYREFTGKIRGPGPKK